MHVSMYVHARVYVRITYFDLRIYTYIYVAMYVHMLMGFVHFAAAGERTAFASLLCSSTAVVLLGCGENVDCRESGSNIFKCLKLSSCPVDGDPFFQ